VLLFVVSILPVVQLMMQQKEPSWIAAVPVSGQYSLLNIALRGEALSWAKLSISYAVPLAIAAIALAAVARLLSREAILGSR